MTCFKTHQYNFKTLYMFSRDLTILSRRTVIFQDTLTSWTGVLKMCSSILKKRLEMVSWIDDHSKIMCFQDTYDIFQDMWFFSRHINNFSRHLIIFQDASIHFKDVQYFFKIHSSIFKTLEFVSRHSTCYQDTLTSWKSVFLRLSWKSVLKWCLGEPSWK